MFTQEDKLNMLRSKIEAFRSVLIVFAAEIEAKADELKDRENKDNLMNITDSFNIAGAWIQLLGDYLLFKAAELELPEEVQSNESFDEETLKLNILATQAQVLLHLIFVELAERSSYVAQ